jgi:hypothetical protein
MNINTKAYTNLKSPICSGLAFYFYLSFVSHGEIVLIKEPLEQSKRNIAPRVRQPRILSLEVKPFVQPGTTSRTSVPEVKHIVCTIRQPHAETTF